MMVINQNKSKRFTMVFFSLLSFLIISGIISIPAFARAPAVESVSSVSILHYNNSNITSKNHNLYYDFNKKEISKKNLFSFSLLLLILSLPIIIWYSVMKIFSIHQTTTEGTIDFTSQQNKKEQILKDQPSDKDQIKKAS